MALGLLHALSSFGVDYTYTTKTTTSGGSSAVSAVIALLAVALFIFMLVAAWKLYVKAGRPGWAAIIPLYNVWVLLEMGGQPGWIALLVLIPFIGGLVVIVFEIIALLEVGRRFGKSGAWSFFLLFLFPIIGWPILAFGDATYTDPGTGSAVGTGGVPAPAATPVTNPAPPVLPQATPPTQEPTVPPTGEQNPPQPPTVSGPTVG